MKSMLRRIRNRSEREDIVFAEQAVETQDRYTDGLPFPPRALWNSGAPTIEQYLEEGRKYFDAMRTLLSKHAFVVAPGARILDFGCGPGRMTRFWKPDAGAAEIWGCEITDAQVRWCQANLTPPFRFLRTTTTPHLPFEDNYFTLIYAGSVFTHISDFADMWLAELRRISRPGGLLYLTIHDEHTWKLVKDGKGPALERALHLSPVGGGAELTDDFVSVGVGPESQTFYRLGYFEKRCRDYFTVLESAREARGYQTAVILRK